MYARAPPGFSPRGGVQKITLRNKLFFSFQFVKLILFQKSRGGQMPGLPPPAGAHVHTHTQNARKARETKTWCVIKGTGMQFRTPCYLMGILDSLKNIYLRNRLTYHPQTLHAFSKAYFILSELELSKLIN